MHTPHHVPLTPPFCHTCHTWGPPAMQYLHEAGYSKLGKIGCTQPRWGPQRGVGGQHVVLGTATRDAPASPGGGGNK